jgi:hypothetical protein
VYPAAGLVEQFKGTIYYIDPEARSINNKTIAINKKATDGMKELLSII